MIDSNEGLSSRRAATLLMFEVFRNLKIRNELECSVLGVFRLVRGFCAPKMPLAFLFVEKERQWNLALVRRYVYLYSNPA